jgi:hypothetical protein
MIQWKQTTEDDGQLSWKLLRHDGTTAATVWVNALWHTWDEDGAGGENGKGTDILHAKHESLLSALNQGFLP